MKIMTMKEYRKAEAEYRKDHGINYCLFKRKNSCLYEVAQFPIFYMSYPENEIIACDIVKDLETKSFYEACSKAYDMGYRGVLNSIVEELRKAE